MVDKWISDNGSVDKAVTGTSWDTISNKPFEQAIAVGRSFEEAQAFADTQRKFAYVLEKRFRVDALDHFENTMGLNVRRKVPEALAGEDVPISLESALVARLQFGKRVESNKPIMTYLKKQGINPDSEIAAELRNRGMTNKTMPGLFKKDGTARLDSIVRELLDVQDDSGRNYVDVDALVAAIEAEANGDSLLTVDQEAQAERLDDPTEALAAELGAYGIQWQELTAQEIERELGRMRAQAQREGGGAEGDVQYQTALDELLAEFEFVQTPEEIAAGQKFLAENEARDKATEATREAEIQAKIDRVKSIRDRLASETQNRTESAAWTDERLTKSINRYEHANRGETKGQIGFVDPLDFLWSTTTPESAKIIADETGTMDKEELARQDQTPFLMVEDGDIIGHEGRHRMLAMARAGVVRAPIEISRRGDGYQTFKGEESPIFGAHIFGDASQCKAFRCMMPVAHCRQIRLKFNN